MARSLYLVALVVAVAIGSVVADSNINPDHRFAWSENSGWTNWQHDAPNPGDGVLVSDTLLSGFVWAENVGWINLGDGSPLDGIHYPNTDDTNFGVNIDPDSGDLFGLAWGENVGWINFDTSVLAGDRSRVDSCSGRLLGFVWGENIGWINLDDDTHFVSFEIADCDSDGVADSCETDCNANGIPDECEAGVPVLLSDPPNCSVDARQPHDPLNPNTRFGWTEITFDFNCVIAQPPPGSFSVTVEDGTPPSIIDVIESENTFTLILDDPIPAGQWTCFTHDASGAQTCLGYLPADVNGGGVSAPSDILSVIDSLNGVVPRPEYATDVDRSGASGPADILRVIDLLNGAAAFEPWLDVMLSDCPSGN